MFAVGRRVIVLSDRVKLTEDLHKGVVDQLGDEPVGVLLGKTKAAERAESLTKQVLLCTNSMCKMGLDQPTLDTVRHACEAQALSRYRQRLIQRSELF